MFGGIIEIPRRLINNVCSGYENNTPFFSKIVWSPEKLKTYIGTLKRQWIDLLECFGSDAHHIKHLFCTTMALKWWWASITVNDVIDALLKKDKKLIPQKATRLSYYHYYEMVFWHLTRSHVEKLGIIYILQILQKFGFANSIPNILANQAAKKKILY